jgi:hypothetical protein
MALGQEPAALVVAQTGLLALILLEQRVQQVKDMLVQVHQAVPKDAVVVVVAVLVHLAARVALVFSQVLQALASEERAVVAAAGPVEQPLAAAELAVYQIMEIPDQPIQAAAGAAQMERAAMPTAVTAAQVSSSSSTPTPTQSATQAAA